MQIGLITHADKCKGTSASPPSTVSYDECDVSHNSADRNLSLSLHPQSDRFLLEGENIHGLKVLCEEINLKLHTAEINI